MFSAYWPYADFWWLGNFTEFVSMGKRFLNKLEILASTIWQMTCISICFWTSRFSLSFNNALTAKTCKINYCYTITISPNCITVFCFLIMKYSSETIRKKKRTFNGLGACFVLFCFHSVDVLWCWNASEDFRAQLVRYCKGHAFDAKLQKTVVIGGNDFVRWDGCFLPLQCPLWFVLAVVRFSGNCGF